MRKKLYLFYCALSCLSCVLFAQQDDQLSQYAFNPLAVNPAYAGSREVMNASLSARSQWSGFQGSPQTIALALSSPLSQNKMALGFRLRDEKNLFEQKLEASVCYAYRIHLLNGKLALGLSAGLTNSTFNWFNADFKDNTDVFAQNTRSSVLIPRFDAGVFFNNEKSFLSLSASHLYDKAVIREDGSKYSGNLKPHLYFAYSRAFVLNDNLILNPAIVGKWTNTTDPLVDMNLYLCIKNIFWIGSGYRSNNSMLFLAQIVVHKTLRIGYSYDAMPSGLLHPYSTHEVLLSIDLQTFKGKALSFRYF